MKKFLKIIQIIWKVIKFIFSIGSIVEDKLEKDPDSLTKSKSKK